MDNVLAGEPGYVVWSPGNAAHQIHVNFDQHDHPLVLDSAGNRLKVSLSKNVATLPVSSVPIVVEGIHTFPVPQEVVADATSELQKLIAMADKLKVDTTRAKQQLFYTTNKIQEANGSNDLKMNVLESAIADITDLIRPYAWIEAESAKTYTFDTLAADGGASHGAYLSLNTDRDPPDRTDAAGKGYVASYDFDVNASGRYTIWMAGSELDTDDVSPFSYQIDDGAENDVRGVAPGSPSYDAKFYWSQIGAETLTRGRHTLTIAVYTPRKSDGRYALAIDAFCLDREAFHPDGVNPPTVDTSLPAPAAK
jgi:hypothetical protein